MWPSNGVSTRRAKCVSSDRWTADFYSPAHDRGIAWHDPVLMITWPVTIETAIVSERDRPLPRLSEQPDLFEYPEPPAY